MVKRSKKYSVFRTRSRRSRMTRKGGQFTKNVDEIVTYRDPIFNETITYSTKCSDDKDEIYRGKREAWVKALTDVNHPCNIGTEKDKELPKPKEVEECETNHPEFKDGECKKIRIPTQSQIDECDRLRKEVMDEPCGTNFKSKTLCIAGNSGQAGSTIRRFRGEPIRVANKHLKETDETQNYDEFGETKVSKYCDKYRQKYCEPGKVAVDLLTGKILSGSWAKHQDKNFKCALMRATGPNNTCINGWGVEKDGKRDCNIHGMQTDLEEPQYKTEIEMNEIENQFKNIGRKEPTTGGYKKNKRIFSRRIYR